jgi:hypothetical protein
MPEMHRIACKEQNRNVIAMHLLLQRLCATFWGGEDKVKIGLIYSVRLYIDMSKVIPIDIPLNMSAA